MRGLRRAVAEDPVGEPVVEGEVGMDCEGRGGGGEEVGVVEEGVGGVGDEGGGGEGVGGWVGGHFLWVCVCVWVFLFGREVEGDGMGFWMGWGRW